jgi:hypothetical protein
MKKASLLRVEFWWWLEKLAGELWQRITPDDAVSSWFDGVPAFVYEKRKSAEQAHTDRFEENIYGEPL